MPALGLNIGLPYLLSRSGGAIPIPPPPYAVFSSDGISILTNISGLDYSHGSGPSPSSAPFELLASGLLPASDHVTITPSGTDFEIFNPVDSTWYDTAFNVNYTGGAITQTGFMVRLKAGLSPTNYSGTFTITSPNASPFILTCTGKVIDVPVIVATGGIITQVGDNKVHTFLGSDIFDVTHVGTGIYSEISYLIVAGGGGGGGSAAIVGNATGGGGGGGLIYKTNITIGINSYPVIIGAGGNGGGTETPGSNGSDSSFNTDIANGGGGGGATGITSIDSIGKNGGSGGGGGSLVGLANEAGGIGTVGQGNDGGQGDGTVNFRGGGGGGAGAVGNSGSVNGNGGDGFSSLISGTSTYYSGGGGGGAYALNVAGLGGQGGGGSGAQGTTLTAISGTNNTGGGGGGAGSWNVEGTSGNGGSGIVIISYYSPA